MNIYDELREYPHVEKIFPINFLKIPLNRFAVTEDDSKKFNNIYNFLKASGWKNSIPRTPSGGISTNRHNLRLPCYEVITTGSSPSSPISIEILFLHHELGQYRFLWGVRKEQNEVSGRQAFTTFKRVCDKYSCQLEELAVENGEEYKKQFPEIKISLRRVAYAGPIFEHAHHLDLNSSYFSGIMTKYPQLRPAVEEIYQHRKDKTEYGKKCKDILTHTYGYFQSKWCKYKYANLSLAAIQYNNAYIDMLTDRLLKAGNRVIAYNTDGIWYDGPVYHDEFEGTGLCQWKNDHIDCKLRFKSKGSYEFIEDGVYTPVVRGLTTLDRIKPDRTTWEWGDIFKASIRYWFFDIENGIIWEEE